MAIVEDFPEPFKHIQHSLQPYIKPRQETLHIRRILASHLESHVRLKEEHFISRPLSLIDSAIIVDTPSTGVRGIRREYIRAARANIKARKEYDDVKKQHRVQANTEHSGQIQEESRTLDSFLKVVKYRRKHERLRIIQDYVDMLVQKPAALASHLDPKLVLKDMEPLPKVPQDVMNVPVSHHDMKRTDLKELMDKLEKSVLRAKLLLGKEQNLLAKTKSGDSESVTPGGRLQALGTARNELITWIETELARAGETNATSDDGQEAKSSERREGDYIERWLDIVRRQYSQYTKSRQTLIIAATGNTESPLISTNDEGEVDLFLEKEPLPNSSGVSCAHRYLEELLSISNQQKSCIQLKSHLTISLAKNLKETTHVMDRFVEESHLLPAHPMTSGNLQRQGLASFADEISNYEKPDSSHRARAWVFASHSASLATKESISEKLKDGGQSISEAQRTLQDLYTFLGEQVKESEANEPSGKSNRVTKDIWGQLDGQLGVIQTDEQNPS